jgi:hypothetical protein
MKRVLVALMVVLLVVLMATPVAASPAAAPLPVEVTVVTAEGQISTYQYVPGTPIPAPEPCGGVIVTYADGTGTVITCQCTLWWDAAGNTWAY